VYFQYADKYYLPCQQVEDGDASKSSSSTRGKKPIVKKVVMEYCYEPEMEEVMLKNASRSKKFGFKKTRIRLFSLLALHLYIHENTNFMVEVM
jgi:hypothetical protein